MQADTTHHRRTGLRRAGSTAAFAVLLLAVPLASCSEDPVEPTIEVTEPDPFPNPLAVRLWMYATGIVLSPGESFQQGFFVDEPGVTISARRYPLDDLDTDPFTYRMAWWSENPSVASVGAGGVVVALGEGQAVIRVQVESERDSAVITVDGAGSFGGPVYQSIQTASSRACALATTGDTYCWGADVFGALGRGRVRWFQQAAAPGIVTGGQVFDLLATREDHTCGLTGTGAVWCWGENDDGQLGNGLFDQDTLAFEAGEAAPVQVLGSLAFGTIASSEDTTCGLDAAGTGYCWGSNFRGELGIGSPDPADSRAEPTAVVGGHTFQALAAGLSHFCGVTVGGDAYCWGDHNEADGATGTMRRSDQPVLVNDSIEYAALAGGLGFSCGLTAGGAAHCWGRNGDGQLGSDLPEGSVSPLVVQGGHVFVEVAAGSNHTCARTAAGTAFCWGDNALGQLGVGQRDFDPNPIPQEVTGGRTFSALSAAENHTCGISNGAAYCWGWVGSGRLGNGEIEPIDGGPGTSVQAAPVRVVAPIE